MKKTIIAAAALAGIAGARAYIIAPPQAAPPVANAWELRQVGTGLACHIAQIAGEGVLRIAPDQDCAAIHAALAASAGVQADGERIAFLRDDGSVALEFRSDEGGVYEAVGAGAQPLLLSLAE